MEDLPRDPFILMSYLNTKLRDEYTSLSALCDGMELDEAELLALLREKGLVYRSDKNRVENP